LLLAMLSALIFFLLKGNRMARLAYVPDRIIDHNGIADGATVYVYQSGTTTPISIYSDSACTVPYANPFTVAAGAAFPHIYYTYTSAIRMKIVSAVDGSIIDNDPYDAASNGSSSAVTRPELAGMSRSDKKLSYLAETGREGDFVFSTANLSTKVAADTAQGIYVAPNNDSSGASGAWVRKFDSEINVKWFGAKGDSNVTGSTGTDDTTAIQAALSYLTSIGGGAIYFPEGYYKISSYLTVPQYIRIKGASRMTAVIVQTAAGGGGANLGQSIRNGSIFYSGHTSNSSVAAEIVIQSLGIIGVNGASVGAAFYDNDGTYIKLEGCDIGGSLKYGAVFDQSELFDVVDCNIHLPGTSGAGVGACVYLVNGATLTPGNAGGFVNRGSIQRCQLNAGTTVDLVRSEGCGNLGFLDNNYNGGRHQLNLTFTQFFTHVNGEFEASALQPITMTTCYGTFVGGLMNGGADASSPVGLVGAQVAFVGTYFASAQYAVSGAGDSTVTFTNCITSRADKEFAAGQTFDYVDTRITLPIKSSFGQASWDLNANYQNGIIRCSAASTAANIRDDGTACYPIGTTYILEQMSGAGPCSFTVSGGAAISGPTATNAVGQRLTARKIAANTWQTELTLQNGHVFGGPITVPEIAAASVATPAANLQTLFIDTADHKLKRKDSAGTVTIIA
jgi:hypothetical protein